MLLQYFESNGFSLFFDMDPTPSVRTHLPSQQSTTTLGLGCVSSPFNNAPSTIKQTAQSDRLPPFHNYYQPYVQSAVWHTEYTCNTRAAQPVFYPAKVMKENWKLETGDGHTSLGHESFTHGYTLVYHCDHFHCPKRSRQEEENLLNKAQKRTRKDHSIADILDLLSEERCDKVCKQSEKNQLSHSVETDIQEPSTETAQENELENHALKQSDRITKTDYDENSELKSGRSSQNISSIHYIASPKLQLSLSSIATEHRGENQRLRPEIPHRVNDFWESINRPDSECKSRYVGTAKRCQSQRNKVKKVKMRGNENQRGIQRITCHPSRSEGSKYSDTMFFNKTWDKDRESSTMPPQKRTPLDGDSRASLRVPQQKQFDEARRLGSQQSEDNNTQLLNSWSGIHNSYRTEFGDVTQHVQTIATSKRLENINKHRIMKQRPRNSKLPPTSKFSSDEATDVDNTLLLTIPFNQDESSPQLTCSAQRNKPVNIVYKEGNLAENDWAGDSCDHNYLPRIVAVHTIVEDRSEKTQRKELRGAKRLSSNEKKEWNSLLADLSSSCLDGYYDVEHKRSSPTGHVYPTLSVSYQH